MPGHDHVTRRLPISHPYRKVRAPCRKQIARWSHMVATGGTQLKFCVYQCLNQQRTFLREPPLQHNLIRYNRAACLPTLPSAASLLCRSVARHFPIFFFFFFSFANINIAKIRVAIRCCSAVEQQARSIGFLLLNSIPFIIHRTRPADSGHNVGGARNGISSVGILSQLCFEEASLRFESATF